MVKKTSLHIITFLFIILCKQNNFGQTLILNEINSFSQRGNDTTLILLEKIKPTINFEKDIDLALEYFLIKFNYYHNTLNKKKFKKVLSEAEPYYEKSKNDYLKLSYDIACIHRDEIKLENFGQKIRHYQREAIRIKAPDLLIETNILLFRMSRKRLETDSMNYYLDEAIQIAKKNNLKVEQARLYRLIGNVEFRKSNFDKSIESFDKSESLFTQEGFVISAAKALAFKARIYQEKREYEKAFKTYQKTLDVFEEHKLFYRVALINMYLGHMHQDLGNEETAIKQFLLAKEIVIDSLYPFIAARLDTDLGNSYLALGNYKEGKKYLEKSILAKEKIKDNYTLSGSYNSLGELYLEKGDFKNARIKFENAIAISEKTKANISLDRSYLGLLNVSLKNKEISLAEKYGKQAIEYSDINKSVESKFSTLLCLAKLSTLKKEHEKANHYYQTSISLRDSVINFKKTLKVSNIIADYENQKKELEILSLKYENQEKEGTIQQNKLRSTLYLLGLFSSFVILLLFVRGFIQNRKSSLAQKKLNDSLNESNEKLSESNQQLEHFAHMASHDLKSPLRTMTSFSSLLQKTTSSKLDDKEKEFLSFIVDSGKNLSVMIDDMLDYSKVGSQNIILKLTDMNSMINETLTSLESPSKENAIELKQLNLFPESLADKVKLRRVFQNIISNAIKFYDPNKDDRFVHLDYKSLDDYHQFSIADNGIGIPEKSKNIFEPFTYLNSKDDYKGTGIGLAMCQKIIEKHGGKIWYESELKKGTTFYFTIKR